MLNNLPLVRGEYRINYSLKNITWFKVGGEAEVLYKPADKADLQIFLQQVSPDTPLTVLGNCSNVIVRDGGIEGVVIKLGRSFADITMINDNTILAGGGALNSSVATFCMQNGFGGLEFLVGIPGTIGGGIRMNAGAYGTEFKDVTEYIIALDRQGNELKMTRDEAGFSYRHCSLSNELIFTGAIFKIDKTDPVMIKEKMQLINEKRTNSQPIKEKTGGSTFANPEGARAWELIDQCGMRGYRIGDAMFSTLHCNFMINNGNATAKDLEELGELAINKVYGQTRVKLNWEIRRLGKYD